MSKTIAPAERRTYLYDVSWETYLSLVADNPSGRLTYNDGMLEIMLPSLRHERARSLMCRMVETFTEETDVDICSVGSVTMNRVDVQKGIEADESYYVGDVTSALHGDDLDLSIHPPPDLAIEVDIRRTSKGKFEIYAAIGIEEVWRYHGDAIIVYRFSDGQYQQVGESVVVAGFPLQGAAELLKQQGHRGDNSLIREFRQRL